KQELMPLIFSDDDLAFQRRIRDAFNPDGRLNPNKLLPSAHMCAEIRAEAARAAASTASPAGVSCHRNPRCGHAHLDLRACSALRFHSPGDLTVGADAGMTVAALDRVLAPHGQFVPIEVPE